MLRSKFLIYSSLNWSLHKLWGYHGFVIPLYLSLHSIFLIPLSFYNHLGKLQDLEFAGPIFFNSLWGKKKKLVNQLPNSSHCPSAYPSRIFSNYSLTKRNKISPWYFYLEFFVFFFFFFFGGGWRRMQIFFNGKLQKSICPEDNKFLYPTQIKTYTRLLHCPKKCSLTELKEGENLSKNAAWPNGLWLMG